ncbi:hypothetical protein [uncultured Oscillibacter sp.]|uniref:hypothetical protein n=1 Tax=uncultured Oscillibacter sp. TaxID=876091 RepID=UPI00261B7B45|nr:hypothetical protein [uncultured Oscillibacter sp.]
MAEKTLYTALGHFRCRHDKGRRYPVILMDHHEFGMDPQEMTLWTALCWRLTERQRAEDFYEQLSNGMELFPRRSFSDCLDRLVTRGLVAKGSGTTDFDALYDLLGGLYVVPISSSFPLKVVTFLKLLRSGTAPGSAFGGIGAQSRNGTLWPSAAAHRFPRRNWFDARNAASRIPPATCKCLICCTAIRRRPVTTSYQKCGLPQLVSL